MRTRSLNALSVCLLVFFVGLCPRASGQSGIISTVAGSGVAGFSGDGGAATSASLNFPSSVTVDASGNLFIVDFNNFRVRKVAAGGVITTFAGNGVNGYSDYTGPATSAAFKPTGVAADASGNLFIADYYYLLRKVSASGIMTTVAGLGGGGTPGLGDGGPAISADLYLPKAVAVDASGNLFIADSGYNRIRKVSVSGIITTVAGNGVQGFSGDGGPATSASFSTIGGVAVDASGNLFIADLGNNRIRKVSASGIISTFAGNGTSSFSGDGGLANSATLSGPGGVAVDTSGNLFIADSGNNRIRKVSASGIITTVVGGGTGSLGDGGLATSASLYEPAAVAVDAAGNLFIADTLNNRIRKVSAPASSGSPVAIPLPAAVNTVDVNPITNQVYVGGNITNVVQNIVWIDGNTNSIVKSLGVGQGLHVNPATNKIYAADLYAGHILVYSGSDGSLLNTISTFGCPVEAVVDSSLNHIWGSGQCGGGNDPAFLIDGSTNTLISGYIGSGGVMGGAMAVNPATHALYMSVGGVEKEVNASTFAVTNAPFSASVVAFNLLAASMYGADSSGKNVVVINYGTESAVATLPVSQTGAIAVNPTRSRVYAVDLSVSPQAIAVFAGGSNTLIGSIPLRSGDQACCTMAVNSSSGTIYLPVVNSGLPFLLVIDDTLTSNPPVSTPALTSLSPSTSIAGAGALTLTVNGSGFVTGSVVQWNGAALTTTFVNATQLTAAVPASDLASAGTGQITVVNPGVAASNALPFTISQAVNSGKPAVTLSPTGLTFGNQTVGTSSSMQSTTITNSGTAALSITGITITGANSADYAETNTCGSSLAAGASCGISVTFTPAATGGRSASLSVTDNAANSPQAVGLTGTGQAPTASFTPTSLSFGSQIVGRTSPPQYVTVTSGGNVSLAVAGITIAGANSADFAQTSQCGSLAVVSGSCSLTVTFTPTATGPRTASLSMAGNAGNPQTVSLTGTGQAVTGPAIAPNGIVNAAGFGAGSVAPGSIVAIFGTNMASSAPGSGVSATSVPLPTSLSGAQVVMNGIKAPLFYADAEQINAQVPWEVNGASTLVVQVFYSGAASNTASLPLAPTAPGIFVINHASDGTLVTAQKPAVPGEYLTIFCAGLGAVSNQPATGMPASLSTLSPVPTLPVVMIDGIPGTVTFAGLAPSFVGVDQVNVIVPGGLIANSNAQLAIAMGNGVSHGVALATAPAGNGFQSSAAATDANGNVTMTPGSIRIPLHFQDQGTSAALANLLVTTAVDSANPSYAVVAAIDPAGVYPPRFALLQGITPGSSRSASRVSSQTNGSQGDSAITIPVSQPSANQSPFFTAAVAIQTSLLQPLPNTNQPASGAIANAFQFAFQTLSLGLPISGAVGVLASQATVETKVESTSEAAVDLSPFNNGEEWIIDQSKDAATDVLKQAEGLSGEVGEITPMGVLKATVFEPSILAGGIYPFLGFDEVKVTTVKFAGMDQLHFVLPESPHRFTGNDPFSPPPPAQVCTQPAVQNAQISILNPSDGLAPLYHVDTDATGCATFSALRPGSYQIWVSGDGLAINSGALVVTANGGNSTTIPVTVLGGPGPILTSSLILTPSSLSFSANQGDPNPAGQTLSAGSSSVNLTWNANSNSSWLTVSPPNGTTPTTATVLVSIAGLSPGTYSGAILFISSTPGVSSVTVPVTLIINPPVSGTDSVTKSLSSLGSVGGCAGGSLSATITVTAPSGVTWTAVNNFNVGQARLSLSPLSGTGSGVVHLTLTVPSQTPLPGGSCGFTYSNNYNDDVPFQFSDGTTLFTLFSWTYILLD